MKKVHFIAVGGSIMHQLAIALHKKGYEVSGSDDEIYDPALSNLKKNNLYSGDGWDTDKITTDLDAVILGMHARNGNPELDQAKALGLSIFSFPEYIFEESKHKKRVVVGGSHGKTTITSMIMHVLNKQEKDFDYLVGAKVPGFESSVKMSDAPLIVCEGDEYPASALKKVPKFFFYHPHISVLSGIAWDHMNVFPTYENYVEQFQKFIEGLATGSTLIYNGKDGELSQLVKEYGSHLKAIPFAIPEHKVENGKTQVVLNGYAEFISVFGDHNLMDLQAAALVCQKLGISSQNFLTAIKDFEGAAQRLEKIYEDEKTTVFRDFAHAPSKVEASLNAVKEQFPDRKLTAVAELHTYSSLNKDFLPQYEGKMDAADNVAVFYDPHAVKIKKLPFISPEQIKEGFKRQNMEVISTKEELLDFISQQDSDDANLLIMSSGSLGGTTNEDILAHWGNNK
ncbi:MAG TPA: Mur ligase family protein [Chitinophagaceae bacterium]|nr:Mur ligase family protein [Chitinophagaceae bacterium]